MSNKTFFIYAEPLHSGVTAEDAGRAGIWSVEIMDVVAEEHYADAALDCFNQAVKFDEPSAFAFRVFDDCEREIEPVGIEPGHLLFAGTGVVYVGGFPARTINATPGDDFAP